jgi:hypothetical protein
MVSNAKFFGVLLAIDPPPRRTPISATRAEVVRQIEQLIEAQLQEVLAFPGSGPGT